MVQWTPIHGFLTLLAQEYDRGSVDNIWCFDDRTHSWGLQVNLEDGDYQQWIYRHCHAIRTPWGQAVLDVDGLRVVAPEVQLLWKSKTPTAKDLRGPRTSCPSAEFGSTTVAHACDPHRAFRVTVEPGACPIADPRAYVCERFGLCDYRARWRMARRDWKPRTINPIDAAMMTATGPVKYPESR